MALTVALPDGTPARLEFKHVQFPVPMLHARKGGRIVEIKAVTIAKLLVGHPLNGSIVGQGFARCSITDQFDKETGRRVALDHLASDFNRDMAGKILASYYSRPKGRKHNPHNPTTGE